MSNSLRARALSMPKPILFDMFPSESPPEQMSPDVRGSNASFDRFCSNLLTDGLLLIGSPREASWDGDESSTSTSLESSPLGWTPPPASRDSSRIGKLHSLPKYIPSRAMTNWEDRGEKNLEDSSVVSEVELMKERFAKLLLGEDHSGGGKGVSSALAISNAITNLSVSVFGQLYKLEPLDVGRKFRWQREMGWILSVSDYIVDFVPSEQLMPNGTSTQVMITKPRKDLLESLPALRKLDNMLLEALDSFDRVEFWYVGEKDAKRHFQQEEKWWLPTVRVPPDGLSAEARNHLEHQKGSVNQIFKMALEINAIVLSDMEIPDVYWKGLPKNARTVLGDMLYRAISSKSFSPDALILSLDPSQEHNIIELVNRINSAVCIWQKKLDSRQMQTEGKEGVQTVSKSVSSDQEMQIHNAQNMLTLIKHKFPGLSQTQLDMSKIQYNKDVGHSILESYSRVLESLAFNVLSRINDVLQADDAAKYNSTSVISQFSNNPNFYSPKSSHAHPSGMPKSSSVHAIHTSSHSRPMQSKSLSDFIGYSSKDAEGNASEHSDKSPHWYSWSPQRRGR